MWIWRPSNGYYEFVQGIITNASLSRCTTFTWGKIVNKNQSIIIIKRFCFDPPENGMGLRLIATNSASSIGRATTRVKCSMHFVRTTVMRGRRYLLLIRLLDSRTTLWINVNLLKFCCFILAVRVALFIYLKSLHNVQCNESVSGSQRHLK